MTEPFKSPYRDPKDTVMMTRQHSDWIHSEAIRLGDEARYWATKYKESKEQALAIANSIETERPFSIWVTNIRNIYD